MSITKYIVEIEQQRKEEDALYHSAAVKYGLSDTAMWVLYIVSEEKDGLTQQELCQWSYCAKQTINTAVNSLAKSGLVELIPIPGTRNHKKVRLTAAGWELANRTTKHLKAAEERAYGRLTEEELQAYLDTAKKINAYLRQEIEKL